MSRCTERRARAHGREGERDDHVRDEAADVGRTDAQASGRDGVRGRVARREHEQPRAVQVPQAL